MLNNRPFQEAIAAIHGRPAYREVDRRLVYIDPHPASAGVAARITSIPGFFATLRGALSDIPSSQPVTDELGRVVEFNDQVRRLRAIIDSARPQISQLVAKVVTPTFDRPISTDDLRAWREQVNSHVAVDAGFAYQAYVRLKLASVRAFGAQLIVKLRGVPAQSPMSRVVAEIIDAWAVRKGIVYERADSEALELETQTGGSSPGLGEISPGLRRQVSRAPPAFPDRGAEPALSADRAGALRRPRSARGRSAQARVLRTARCAAAPGAMPSFYSHEVRDLVAEIFPAAPSAGEIKHLDSLCDRVRRAERPTRSIG